ncbi:MAG: lipopolysaccharide biosynthesis protein [Gammaproteobacteria bacterium]
MSVKKFLSVNIFLTFFNVLVNFFVLVFLSHIFIKADLVIYTLLSDTLKIFCLFFTGFKDAVVRVFSHSDEKKQVFRGMWIAGLIFWFIEALFILPILQFYYLPHRLAGYDYQLWQLEAVLACLVWGQLIGYMMLANRIYKVISISDFIKSILFIVTFIILYAFVPMSSGHQYLMMTFLISMFLFVLWIWRMLGKYVPEYRLRCIVRVSFWKNKYEAKQFYQYSVIATTEYVCAYFYVYFSSFMILNYYGTDDLANFQVVARPIYTALISIFSFPVFRFLLPEYSNLLSEKKHDEVLKVRKHLIKLISVFAVIGWVGTWLTSRFWVTLFFPNQYAPASQMLDVLIIALPFVVYTASSFAIIKASGGFWHTLLTRVLGALAFVVCFFASRWFTPSVYAVIGSMVASVFVMFFYAFLVEKYYLRKL